MIRAVQDLRLIAKMRDVRPLPGVRAGSGLIWHGDRLVVVQDDAFSIALVEPASGAIAVIPFKGDGAGLPKPLKPDFEAIFRDGESLWLIGSGSKPSRRTWAQLDLASSRHRLVDASPVYEAIAQALGGTPNLEGAVLQDGMLRLFHRAEGRSEHACAIAELPFDPELGARPEVRSLTRYDLGCVEDVALTFTDAIALPGDRLLYSAAAEDTPDATLDGAIVGVALGLLEDGGARWTPLLEDDGRPSVRKVEGIALCPGEREGYLVTDPDDPQRPAELIRFALTGPW